MITEKILNNLEYDKVLLNISQKLNLSMSKNRLLQTRPCDNYDDAKYLQQLSIEGEIILYHYNRTPLENFDDVIDTLNRAAKNSLLNFSDLKKIGVLLRSARLFINSVKDIPVNEIPNVSKLILRLYENKEFEEEIIETFISDDEISDNASPELSSIRKKIRKMNGDIKDRLTSIIKNKDFQKYLQDNIITSREGRFVVPVKSDCKGKINGLIHDYSSSGSTIFVEPIEIVEINNELRMLYLNEKEEIEKILQSFTERVSRMADALFCNEDTLVDFDIIFAKVKYGKTNKGVICELLLDGSFDIIEGRHPLLKDVSVIPVSIRLDKGKNFILISGPNTGGKTVTMKMVGLFALMAISGMYVSAKEGTKISFFNKIFSDIGDEQSIEQNLSTYSSHIKTLINIIDNVDSNSLVLLDEIGGGTDPQEGSALALAVLEYLLEKDSKGIITTHYVELKEYTYTTPKMVNASMEFDMETLSPTYKLNIGTPGTSKALEIATRLGMNKRIIEKAKSKVSPLKTSFDEILNRAEKERLDAEKLKNEYAVLTKSLKENLDLVAAEKEKLIKEKENATKLAKVEAKRIIADAQEEADELVSKIKDIYNKEDEIDGRDVIEASKTKNKLNKILDEESDFEEKDKYVPFDFNKVAKNDYVFVKSLNSVCEVIDLNLKKKEVLVSFGNMKFKAKESDLMLLDNDYKNYYSSVNEKKEAPKIKRAATVKIKDNVKSEINIVGLRVFEAQKEVESFLDRALSVGMKEVKIIHGVGTLALKKMVDEVLRNNFFVKSFRSGQFGEGELGVTIVEFKK